MAQSYDEQIYLCLLKIGSKRSTTQIIKRFGNKTLNQNNFVLIVEETNSSIPKIEIQKFYTKLLKQEKIKALDSNKVNKLMRDASKIISSKQKNYIINSPEDIFCLISKSIKANNIDIEIVFRMFDLDKNQKIDEMEFKNLILVYVPTILPEEFRQLKKSYPTNNITFFQLARWIQGAVARKNTTKLSRKVDVSYKKEAEKIEMQQTSEKQEMQQESTQTFIISEIESKNIEHKYEIPEAKAIETNQNEDPIECRLLKQNENLQNQIILDQNFLEDVFQDEKIELRQNFEQQQMQQESNQPVFNQKILFQTIEEPPTYQMTEDSILETNLYEDPIKGRMLQSNMDFKNYIILDQNLPEVQECQKIYNELFNKNMKYLDSQFQAKKQSLGNRLEQYDWERLSIIWPIYNIFVKDITQSRFGLGKWISPKDIRQGNLGDCYFLSALSSIACRWPDVILELFLTQERNPCEFFVVKLCIDGMWKAIKLDDFIPVKVGRPAFSKSLCQEAWVILLEKAWAKSFGSYSNIISGESREVMRALTGGPTWTLTMQQKDFKQQFQDCIDRRCIMTTGTFAYDKNYKVMGLIPEHSYSILKIRNVKHPEEGEVTLIKLRNPWGEKEWNGKWSDDHELWTQEIKAKLRIHDKDEGEDVDEDGIFYMSYEDFVSYFSTVSIGYFNKSYIYSSQKLISKAKQSLYFIVDIAEKAEYYFSAIQQSSRHFKQQNTDYKYSLMRILLGYKTEQGYEFKEGKQNFDQEVFVGGILEKGQYLIQVKIQWKDRDEQTFNICSYGSKGVKIQLIEKHEEFISQMMIKLARSKTLKPIKKEYSTIMTCSEKNCDIGIGYDYYKNNSNKTLILTCSYEPMRGIKMKKPERGKEYKIMLEPGQDQIISFSVDPEKEKCQAKKKCNFELK